MLVSKSHAYGDANKAGNTANVATPQNQPLVNHKRPRAEDIAIALAELNERVQIEDRSSIQTGNLSSHGPDHTIPGNKLLERDAQRYDRYGNPIPTGTLGNLTMMQKLKGSIGVYPSVDTSDLTSISKHIKVSTYDDMAIKTNADDPNVAIRCYMNLLSSNYHNNPVFKDLTISIEFIMGSYLFYESATTNKLGGHARGVHSINHVFHQQLRMSYNQWQMTNNGMIPVPLWPSTSLVTGYRMEELKHFSTASWIQSGICNDASMAGSTMDRRIASVVVSGPIHSTANIFTNCLTKPTVGSKLYLIYTLRVEGKEDEQQMAEFSGENYHIPKNAIVYPRIETYVSTTNNIEEWVYHTRHIHGKAFLIGKVQFPSDMIGSSNSAHRCNNVLYPTRDSNVYEVATHMGKLPRIGIDIMSCESYNISAF
jgi:hypothetical protein